MRLLKCLVAFLLTSSSAGFTFAVATLLINCASNPAADAATAVAAEGAYTSELVRCEQAADAHAEVKPCRCAADQKFGVDGGNCK